MKDKRPSILYFYLLIIYFSSSIINWLPIIDNTVVRGIKYIIFIIIFLYEINHYGVKYPSNFLSPKGLVVIFIFMIPGLYLSFEFSAIVDITIPFVLLFIFNYKKQFYFKALYESAKVVAIISVFSIFSNYTGIFDIKPSGFWEASFGESGFGGYRTGYSNSLFLFIPILVFWHRIKQKKLLSLDFFYIFFILWAQYLSGGRAGILASLVVLLFWLRVPITYKAAFAVVIIFTSQLSVVQEQFRVQDLETTDNTLDKISSGRVVLNTYYFAKFLEAPVFGYGFGDKPQMYTSTDAHIVWLRNVVDGGIIYLFFIIYIFIEIYGKIKRNIILTSEEHKLFYSMFFTSLIITFIEPNYIIGSVQGETVYWVVISLLLKTHNPIIEKEKFIRSNQKSSHIH